jgi:two-component system, NtrC family, response regulator AtoC
MNLRCLLRASILFAEDDDALRQIVVDELSDAGFVIEAVIDGSVAISCLKSKNYDVVLLDNRMPQKSGIDVLEFIKAGSIQTRSIMVTGVDDLTSTSHAQRLGANGILLKPFSIADLIRCITKVLET